ncbi:hypothetical protein HRbin28_02167 [bacterium HR28]|nr:hypothetical protein HRbin28_02167 [bacterium HR28]
MARPVKSIRFLEGLDITFKAEPVSVATYGEGGGATAVYRYRIHASDTKGEYPGIRGILTMAARMDTGIRFAWEQVTWSDGEALGDSDAWDALALLLRHIAAQLLYQHAWVAVKAGLVKVEEEAFHA